MTERIENERGFPIEPLLTENVVTNLIHTLDCAQRNELDPARKMALCLRMTQEREGAPAEYKARQDAILRPRVRVRGGRA